MTARQHRGGAAGRAAAPVAPAAIEDRIVALLAARREGATICPSEVARALAPDESVWRGLMPQVREAAQRLVEAGRLVVTRGGVPVDATGRGGPIRLGLVPRHEGG